MRRAFNFFPMALVVAVACAVVVESADDVDGGASGGEGGHGAAAPGAQGGRSGAGDGGAVVAAGAPQGGAGGAPGGEGGVPTGEGGADQEHAEAAAFADAFIQAYCASVEHCCTNDCVGPLEENFPGSPANLLEDSPSITFDEAAGDACIAALDGWL